MNTSQYGRTNEGWQVKGCGCGGAKKFSGAPLQGIDETKLLTYLQPTATTVTAPSGASYLVQLGQVFFDIVGPDFEHFKTDPRFRVVTAEELPAMTGVYAKR